MTGHIRRALLLAWLPGLLLVLPGCQEDNEKTAKIQGTAPTNAPKTQAEYGAQQNQNTLKQSGYPGAK